MDTLEYLRNLGETNQEINPEMVLTIFISLIASKSIDEIEANLERYLSLSVKIYKLFFS